MPGKGIAVATGTAGIILVWSGIENRSVLVTLKDLISGTKPTPGPAAVTSAPASSGTATAAGGNPQSATNEAANQNLGKLLASGYGWSSGAEWTALNNIVMAESGWSDTVVNASSGAAGIAQNISGFSASYPDGDASAQIAWLLSYIKQRYGDPVNAWNFHVANGWY